MGALGARVGPIGSKGIVCAQGGPAALLAHQLGFQPRGARLKGRGERLERPEQVVSLDVGRVPAPGTQEPQERASRMRNVRLGAQPLIEALSGDTEQERRVARPVVLYQDAELLELVSLGVAIRAAKDVELAGHRASQRESRPGSVLPPEFKGEKQHEKERHKCMKRWDSNRNYRFNIIHIGRSKTEQGRGKGKRNIRVGHKDAGHQPHHQHGRGRAAQAFPVGAPLCILCAFGLGGRDHQHGIDVQQLCHAGGRKRIERSGARLVVVRGVRVDADELGGSVRSHAARSHQLLKPVFARFHYDRSPGVSTAATLRLTASSRNRCRLSALSFDTVSSDR